MRPSEFEAIRPNLQRAVDDINADFETTRQSREIAKELEGKFDWAAVRESTQSTDEEKELARREGEGGAGPRSYTDNPARSCPLIEWAYPWRHSVARAARDLYDCGWTKESEVITEVLSGLPTRPVDGNQPEILARQLGAIRVAAERILEILTTCLSGPAALPERPNSLTRERELPERVVPSSESLKSDNLPTEDSSKKKKWVQATQALERLIASGVRYTSERDLIGLIKFSQKTIQTAFKKSEALQRWRTSSEETEDPTPPLVESLTVMHLDGVAAPEESPEVDEEEIQIALDEILRVAEPAEQKRIADLSDSEKKVLASLYLSRDWGAYRDRGPDYVVNRRP